MPKKISELISILEKSGFVNRGGKKSHRNFLHPTTEEKITISGKLGANALKYHEIEVKSKLERVAK